MNDQPSIKIDLPLAVAGLMLQVVESNDQLEESEIQRAELAGQELLETGQTEAANLIAKAIALLDMRVGLRALTDELKKAMDLQARINFIKQLWHIAHADGRADKFEESDIQEIARLLEVPFKELVSAQVVSKLQYIESLFRDKGGFINMPLTTAILFMEIARADGRIDDREVAVSIEHLMATFSLERSAAEALIQRSFDVVGNGPGLRAYTDFLAQNTSPDERRKLISSLRKIAKADESVDQYEILEIQNIAEMLGL